MKLTKYMKDAGVADCVDRGLDRLDILSETQKAKILRDLETWKFVINRRATTRHGQTRYLDREVELHVHLLGEGNEDARNQTLLHEIAHIVADLIWDRGCIRAHGKEWKRVMHAFGANPERTSSHASMMEFQLKKANYIYACERCGHDFPAQRKKKYAPSNYVHKRCGGRLYLKENRRNR